MSGDGFDDAGDGQAGSQDSRFGGLFDRFWDSTVTTATTDAEVAFIERNLDVVAPARLLVVPAGCARQALALAQRGHAVLGLDPSADAVDRAALLARRLGAKAEFRSDSALALAEKGFDGAVCIARGGLSPLGDLPAFAASLAAALKPRARAVVGLSDPVADARLRRAFDGAGFALVDIHDQPLYAVPSRRLAVYALA